MNELNHESASVSTARVLDASPATVFAAFEQPECLAQWWGPNGFTNSFELFEFRLGGRWVFVMHGPHGNYPNEIIFRAIERDHRIVLEHIVKPWYRLTITLTAQEAQTHLVWVQEFESADMAERMRSLARTANEQVLDRLEAILKR